MAGELAFDEGPALLKEKRFEVKTYNRILDIMTSSILVYT